MNRDAFFLGSGVSLGMAPGTAHFTAIVVSGLEDYQLGTNERWRRTKPGAAAELGVPLAWG